MVAVQPPLEPLAGVPATWLEVRYGHGGGWMFPAGSVPAAWLKVRYGHGGGWMFLAGSVSATWLEVRYGHGGGWMFPAGSVSAAWLEEVRYALPSSGRLGGVLQLHNFSQFHILFCAKYITHAGTPFYKQAFL